MIDWQAFKRGEFAVRCDTKDKAKAFLQECESMELKWPRGEKATDCLYWSGPSTFYKTICGSLTWGYGSIHGTIHTIDAGKKDEPVSPDQSVKHDAGKPQLTLVPTAIIYDIARVREYGISKYHARDSWREVDIHRYHEAAVRHMVATFDDIEARDEESGLLHLAHAATNIAFILQLMEGTKCRDL